MDHCRRLPWLLALLLMFATPMAQAQTGDEIRARVDARRNSATLFVGSSVADGYLRQLLLEPWSGTWGDDTMVAGAYSYRFARFWRFFMLDGELGGGYRFGDTNGGEFWAAVFLRYDGFPWTEYLYTTIGVSMGPDYVTRLPRVERGTDARPEPNTSRFLNYFSPEFSFALPAAPEYSLVIRYMHRSGIFGTYNGVWEGANTISVGFRFRF